MSDNINVEIDQGIMTICFNRPAKKHAMTSDMYTAMSEAMDLAEQNSDVRVILWTSSTNDFCAGNDLEDFINNPLMGEASPVARFIRCLAVGTVPMVSAVRGVAVGIGSTMLLHCDLNIAAEDAMFIMPFTSLGLVPEAGSTLLLPTTIGYQRAAEFALLGEPLTASQVQEFGLLNRVVPSEDVEAVARSFAAKLAAKPKSILRQSRSMMRKHNTQLLNVMKEEAEAFSEALVGAAAKEAFTAFFEKREANFRDID